ncbi:MAG TPA: DUF2793 domain-containing protein, partial [Methylomirabilota bacterium]|nr:DUF2793 domain-containing protein [Methylomirabilota bacterium]
MSDTARLKLPFLAAAQAQKHLTVNEALGRLDALVQARVASRFQTSPPAGAPDGEAHIVGEGATGEWAGLDGRLAQRFAGGWTVHEAEDGWLVYVADEGRIVVRTGGAWRDLADAAVYYPAGGGYQLKLNKPAAADTASVMLQTGYSGRAEIGLAGDDDLRVKVSADGATWVEALSVDRTDGRVRFPAGALRTELAVFTDDGTWDVPAFARIVRIVAVGGGGGGGSGRRRGPGVESRGGAGGGAGGFARMEFSAADLVGPLIITVGAGGVGGAAVTADDSDGQSGGPGGDSSVASGGDSLVLVTGGAGGPPGKAGTVTAAVGGRGHVGPGGSGGLAATFAQAAPSAVVAIGPGGGGGG